MAYQRLATFLTSGPASAAFGPGGEAAFHENGVDMLYCAFHTTPESRQEVQPHCSASGAVVTWMDG